MKKNKAFTLIELVSVLVILAILALIVTPLVLNIIRKARIAADKRSIDAYGRSIELAIADYLLENGTFPTSIEQLTIEYTGDRVVCETTQLNSDSSVYLAECTVNNRALTGYTFGKEQAVTYKTYSIGDEVTYNNVDYYVVKNSDATESSVTLLKATPITSSEISSYLSSTEVANKVDTTDTYVKMAYYSRDNCISGGDMSGCRADYSVSDVKQLVDIWKNNYANSKDVLEAKLITYDDFENLGYEWADIDTQGHQGLKKTEDTPDWIYSSDYSYWTMTQSDDFSNANVWEVSRDGDLCTTSVYGYTIDGNRYGNSYINVRPIIELKKSALN